MPRQPVVTPEEFDIARAKTRLRDRAANAARAVLVDGLTKSAAARAAELTPEAVRMAVARVEREHKGTVGCPAGWQCVTVCVPGAIGDEIRGIARKAWRAAGFKI